MRCDHGRGEYDLNGEFGVIRCHCVFGVFVSLLFFVLATCVVLFLGFYFRVTVYAAQEASHSESLLSFPRRTDESVGVLSCCLGRFGLVRLRFPV